MKVLVDTSIWSLALRKSKSADLEKIEELKELINELRVVMIGPIRQELLSGISEIEKYNQLKEKLRYFEDFTIDMEYYEFAAQLSNTCRKHGIQGSHTDFLICSVAIKNKFPIFTSDKDFINFIKYIDIQIYECRRN